MAQLKPCPFCGRTLDVENDPDVCFPLDRRGSIWCISCPESAGGCGARSIGLGRHEAISNWNSRTSAPETLESTHLKNCQALLQKAVTSSGKLSASDFCLYRLLLNQELEELWQLKNVGHRLYADTDTSS